MNIPLILRTVRHIKPTQIAFQIKNRLGKANYKEFVCDKNVEGCHCVPFIPKYKCYENGEFSFLNISSPFVSWNDTENGMLWTYNLNYMDWLQQEGIDYTEASQWIDKFIEELPHNRIGLDPYPIALRSINWIKFISQHNADSEHLKRWNDPLYSQVRLLEKKLEFHLLGNHLLEDSYAWFISAIYFNDKRMFSKASKLLLKELKEQILADGSHYEQSPMYHCILLDRLLDCYNFSVNNERFTDQNIITNKLKDYSVLMLGHLESIVYQDKTYPLFNDAANGIAPTPEMLMAYANRLNLKWDKIALNECGYRKLKSERIEAIVDAGNITATYQPGHTHADTFNYELRIDGMPIVVDTGISTYNKTARRQYERSTVAHNTVSIGNRNSSEVWGGFRVGKRAKVKLLKDTENSIEATHNGFGIACNRKFGINGNTFSVEDEIAAEAISHIHLWHKEEVEQVSENEIITTHARISINNAIHIEIRDAMISTEYNTFHSTKVIDIHFKGTTTYNISIR